MDEFPLPSKRNPIVGFRVLAALLHGILAVGVS